VDSGAGFGHSFTVILNPEYGILQHTYSKIAMRKNKYLNSWAIVKIPISWAKSDIQAQNVVL
jgi:hypothetical protein